ISTRHHTSDTPLVFFSAHADHHHLHSFPTRRSSDLSIRAQEKVPSSSPLTGDQQKAYQTEDNPQTDQQDLALRHGRLPLPEMLVVFNSLFQPVRVRLLRPMQLSLFLQLFQAKLFLAVAKLLNLRCGENPLFWHFIHSFRL